MSNAILLSQNNSVVALDVDELKVDAINRRVSPINDDLISDYLANKELDLVATTDKELAYRDADVLVVATPTDYDPETNYFNTSTVESVIKDALDRNPSILIVIKSTVPVGYTVKAREKFSCENIIFSPEFLREGRALYDNLYPSRIVVGAQSDSATIVADLSLIHI